MAIILNTTRSTDLSLSVAEDIYTRLTKERSETNQQMAILVRCLRGESPMDNADDFPMSVCMWADPYTDLLQCVGWVSVTEWDRCLALQGFVDPEFRQKGLASALTSVLLVDGVIHPDVAVAVFADEFVSITKRLGFKTIYRYRQADDGWIRSQEITEVEPETAEGLGQK
jgi:hypothetical protein